MVLKLPDGMLAILYKLGSPFHGSPEEKQEYERDMLHNLKLIREIPVEEEEKIVEFVRGMDNRMILKELKNKALIFNGEKDLFMAAQRGQELHKLLVNSELVINDGEHFDVFTPKDLVRKE